MQHEIAIDLVEKYSERDMNEADTRHQIIDVLLHRILNWPRTQTKCESYIAEGYADYKLCHFSGSALVLIEAKREGAYFNLPLSYNNKVPTKHITVSTLLTDSNIKSAMIQVREYCVEEGCEFAAVTNGHEWIFFRTFSKGKKWTNLKAFVIHELSYFAENYIDARNKFSFEAILKNSLNKILGSSLRTNRTIYFPKEKVPAYDEIIQFNNYARELRAITTRYFGDFCVMDSEFFDHCYVDERNYELASESFRQIIKDSITPYFKNYGVKDFTENSKGGSLGKKIVNSVKSKSKEVIVLFGGKGSGKSTFLNKLLFHNQPKYLEENAIIAIVDLLKTSKTIEAIRNEIWTQITTKLDQDNILKADREQLLELFSDNYELAKKQILYGLEEKSERYNEILNKKIAEWLDDKIYCAQRLRNYWKNHFKGTIVVIDNTDQFSPDLQDDCFSSAEEIADKLNCLVIVSMREERFYSSRINGTLDAYQNSGFHISSPFTKAVFKKRIKYVQSLLNDPDKVSNSVYKNFSKEKITACIKLFDILENEYYVIKKSHLNDFLSACSHGNIRKSLELFRSFVLSGYTNVDEMVSADNIWVLKSHQVLKPLMIPDRLFYDESSSAIPNIFQIRSKTSGSHFTSLRIFQHLTASIEHPVDSFFHSIGEFKEIFENYNMIEDLELNLDMLLKHGLIESNNRLDCFSNDIDSIRITNYGLYIYSFLSSDFTYLELVSSDCGIFDETVANEIANLSRCEYSHFKSYDRMKRVETRLKKAETFINYLISEEKSENEFYPSSSPSNFSQQIFDNFIKEREVVMASAEKQKDRWKKKYNRY